MLTYITALPRPTAPHQGVVNWLMDLDAAWRGARHVRGLTDGLLADVGMTRADAEVAFRRDGGVRR